MNLHAADVNRYDAVESLDWPALRARFEADGHAVTPPLLSPRECEALAALYRDDRRFRSTVHMARHGFGLGEYRYFDYPLPEPVEALRSALYRRLCPIANEWMRALGDAERFPERFAEYRRRCHESGQARATPLLLRYERGGYNCLHQDKYGELAFPLQATCLLSRPGADFEGGEFLLVENRPRRQSRGTAVALRQGECVIFPNQMRPARSTRGFYRVQVRHGLSTLSSGTRMALGLIFHDAA